MIGYLKGEILDQHDGKLVVGIGNSGLGSGMVGYVVSVPQNLSLNGFELGKSVELFIHTHVREEALDLYGFSTRSDRILFLTLMNVSGIGPKSALGILSATEPSQLIGAIIDEDQAYLTNIPGIGKKTAERIIVELRDILKKKLDSGLLDEHTKNREIRSQLNDDASASPQRSRSLENSLVQDAKAALIGLGYREQEAEQLLSRVIKDPQYRPKRAEDLIRSALKQLV